MKRIQSGSDRSREARSRADRRCAACSNDSSSPVVSLQRSAGNQAIQELHDRGKLQARLETSDPRDPAEREAERVAAAVVQPNAGSSDSPNVDVNTVPRAAVGDDGGPQSADNTKQLRTALTGGTHLPASTRVTYEARFGRDFSDVRVHTGSDADAAARSIDAEAFTLGSDIAFGRGKYQPTSNAGSKLLAHELTHVVQQDRAGQTEPPIQRQIEDDVDADTEGEEDEAPAQCIPRGEEEAVDEEDREACEEWNAHHNDINTFFFGFDHPTRTDEYYLPMRSLYQDEANIDNPAQWLADNIEFHRGFFGHNGDVNRDTRDDLDAIDASLDGEIDVHDFSGLSTRAIRGGTSLSNHATGHAVDINPDENPLITSDDVFRVIEAVTDVALLEQTDAADHDTMREASEEFQTEFENWKDETRDRIFALEERLERDDEEDEEATEDTAEAEDAPGGLPLVSAIAEFMELRAEAAQLLRDLLGITAREAEELEELRELLEIAEDGEQAMLEELADTGFLNLEQELIDEFLERDWDWGGEWISRKDFHHFDHPDQMA